MDFYKILNVSRGASIVDIKKSYRALALKFHPDRNLTNKDVASVKFNAISTAYETLGSVVSKEVYDERIGNTQATRRQQPSARAKNHAATGGKQRRTATSGDFDDTPIDREHFHVNTWNVWHYGADPEKLTTFQHMNEQRTNKQRATRSSQTNNNHEADKSDFSNGTRVESSNVNWEHFHQSIRTAQEKASRNAAADSLVMDEEAAKQRLAYEALQIKREERRQNDPRFRNNNSGIGGSSGSRDKVQFEKKGEEGGGDKKSESSGCIIS
jgi:curved DNA-binding protein CbpA